MKIVVLDGHAVNPGDLSWDFLEKYGSLTVYDRSPVDKIYERAKDADIVILNKTPMSRETVEKLPRLKMIALLATGYNIIDCEACDEKGICVVNIPSYSVKAGQIVGVRERSKSLEVIANSLAGFNHSKYPWLEWDETVKAGKYLHTPERADIPENIKEHLIVELYSK